MEKYLLNKKTGVVCMDGTSSQDILAECEEKEVKGGFLLIGTTQEGTKINCFLTEKEYFDGKEFNINKQYNLTNDSQAMLKESMSDKIYIAYDEKNIDYIIGTKEELQNHAAKLSDIRLLSDVDIENCIDDVKILCRNKEVEIVIDGTLISIYLKSGKLYASWEFKTENLDNDILLKFYTEMSQLGINVTFLSDLNFEITTQEVEKDDSKDVECENMNIKELSRKYIQDSYNLNKKEFILLFENFVAPIAEEQKELILNDSLFWFGNTSQDNLKNMNALLCKNIIILGFDFIAITKKDNKSKNILEEQKQKIDSLDHNMNTRQYIDFIKKEFNVHDISKFKKENKELLNYIKIHMLKFADNMTWIRTAAGMGFTSGTREEILSQLKEDVNDRKVVYIINEEKGFNKLLDKESITDIEKRKEILKGLDMIDISVIMTEENRNYYYTIIDNKTNKIKKEKDFNNWHNSLINNCINHFICRDRQLNEFAEIKEDIKDNNINENKEFEKDFNSVKLVSGHYLPANIQFEKSYDGEFYTFSFNVDMNLKSQQFICGSNEDGKMRITANFNQFNSLELKSIEEYICNKFSDFIKEDNNVNMDLQLLANKNLVNTINESFISDINNFENNHNKELDQYMQFAKSLDIKEYHKYRKIAIQDNYLFDCLKGDFGFEITNFIKFMNDEFLEYDTLIHFPYKL